MTTPAPPRIANEGPPYPSVTDKQFDFYQAYYLLQVQRQNQHETNRLVVSNFVLVGSLAAVGFIAGGEKDLPAHVLIIILVFVGAVNILAALYAKQSRYWVKLHQERARRVLRRISPAIAAMQAEVSKIDRKVLSKRKSGNGKVWFDAFRSERLQVAIHLVLVAGIIGYAVLEGFVL